jgi:hypothetical protein
MIIVLFQQTFSRSVFRLKEKIKCLNKSVFLNRSHTQIGICRTVEGILSETLRIFIHDLFYH